ncbi:MAG: MGMT family protein [Candidatus Micrarchaeia archaeon]
MITYKELAQAIGAPRAWRAAANALARNPFAPKIPCHRVVRSNGAIGGYSGKGGARQKELLLKREGVKIIRGKVVFSSSF